MNSSGLLLRDYSKDPVGSKIDECSVDHIPKSEWRDRIAAHKENKTRPLDFHRDVPVLNQSSLRFCWCFAPVAGVMNRLAFQGIDPVPELSAACVASAFKSGRNVGGYVSQGVEACLSGIPSVDFWPNDQLKDRSFDAESSDAKFNSLATFSELGSDAFPGVMSVLLGDSPRPVAVALPWWKHAVLVLSAEYSTRKKSYGLGFVNSYGSGWQGDGYGVLWGKKAIAHENIVIESATPRPE